MEDTIVTQATWMPGALALSDRDVRPVPSGTYHGASESRTMSANDVTSALGWQPMSLANAIGYDPTERWIRAKLTPLLALPSNWDMYGANPVTEVAASDVRHLLGQLLRQNVTPPQLIPRTDGGISLEWRQPGFEFAIELSGSAGLRDASAYFLDAATSTEWEGTLAVEIARVIAVLNDLVDQGI